MAWEYPSNFSGGDSVTGLGSFFRYMDYASGGWFAESALFIIFSMSLLATMMTSTRKALAVSGFITLIFSFYFNQLGMINPFIIPVLMLITIVGVIGSKIEQSY